MTTSSGRDFLGRQHLRGARAMADPLVGFGLGFFRWELKRYSGYAVAPSYWNRTGITWRATKVRPSRMASLHAIRLSLDELARLLAGYGCSHELLGGDQERSPVRAVRNRRLRGMQPVVGRLDAGGCSTGLHHGNRLEEEPSRLDDGAVCGTEVLAASIDDGAHAFLHRAVLHVDAVDAGEGLRPLHAT